jgi:ubiquinone/menaquinone biosynthesis C-methylase UbiE
LGIFLGIEPSEDMRNIASGRGVNIIDGSAESLPINDAAYDYALLVTTVCFLDSLELAFREASRILKKDGYIIIGLIDKDSVLGKQYEEKKSESKFYKDAIFHGVDEIRETLKKVGFNNFKYVQAVLPGDIDNYSGTAIKQGYGEGSFVVLRAQKYIDA